MSEIAAPQELEAAVRRALRAPDPDPAFVARLHAQLKPYAVAGRRRPRRRAWAWALGAALVLLVAALLIGPSDIVAALQRLLGYIPGIGMVDEAGGLRVLAEPVSQQREGITVSVRQAVLDTERTVVVYQADGIPPEAYPGREDAPFCPDQPILRLPDGSLLAAGEGSGGGWGSGFESRRVFPAIPADVVQAVFVLPCLMDTSPGAAPEDWELPLQFIAAPPDLTVVPVLQITPPVASTPSPEAPAEMGLVLEQVITLDDAYILMGSLRQGESFTGGTVMGIFGWPEITNAAGQPWPFNIPDDIGQPPFEEGVFPWAFQVAKGFAAPLTISLQFADVQFPADLSFTFDAGSDPQPEQAWTVDQQFEIAGYAVRLRSVVLRTEPRYNGYEFLFEGDPTVTGIGVEDRDHTPAGGYGGGSPGEFSVGLVYPGTPPTGLLTFHITGVLVQYPGPWTLTWSPPEGSVTAAPQPEACLTFDAWERALEDPAPRPEGLVGRVIAYGRIVDDGRQLSPDNAGVFVFDLATGQRRILGPGTWPSLSPDGAWAAYSWTDGLHVVDLSSGEDRVIRGTTTNDYDPRWSPDGTRLAFRRIDDLNLYVVNLDGADLRRVTAGPQYELLVDWSADGSRLIYAAPGPNGLSLRSIDLGGTDSDELFVIDAKDIAAALSPDGLLIAFLERPPGSMNYGLFLSALDGSQRRLIAQLGEWGITNPVWSPDGRWLLVSIMNTALSSPPIVPTLIDPSECRAIPLTGIEGMVQGWSR